MASGRTAGRREGQLAGHRPQTGTEPAWPGLSWGQCWCADCERGQQPAAKTGAAGTGGRPRRDLGALRGGLGGGLCLQHVPYRAKGALLLRGRPGGRNTLPARWRLPRPTRPANAVGWLLIATSVLGVNALANQYAVAGLIVAPGKLPAAGLAAWIATWGWTPELVVPVLLPLLFPDGTLPSPRWRPFARAAAGCLVLLVVAAMLAPMGIDANHSITNPAGAGQVFTAVVLAMVALAALVLTPVSVLALVLRQRRARGAERAQLQWLSLAAVVTLALGIASGALRHPGQEALWALALAAIPAGIMIAVLRHQLLDIEVVLNRTVVYGLLSAVVLLGYVVAVAGVGPDAQRTGLVTVVVLALLAASARDRVQRAVDRLLFGYRKDPYAVVTRVGQRLDAAAGPLDAFAAAHRRVAQRAAPPVGGRHPGRPAAGPGRGGRPPAPRR